MKKGLTALFVVLLSIAPTVFADEKHETFKCLADNYNFLIHLTNGGWAIMPNANANTDAASLALENLSIKLGMYLEDDITSEFLKFSEIQEALLNESLTLLSKPKVMMQDANHLRKCADSLDIEQYYKSCNLYRYKCTTPSEQKKLNKSELFIKLITSKIIKDTRK